MGIIQKINNRMEGREIVLSNAGSLGHAGSVFNYVWKVSSEMDRCV